jgi:glycosyltransferase involved in cell wall biosynthesis
LQGLTNAGIENYLMRICFFGKPDAPQLRRVVRSLADRGHDVQVVYRGPGEIPGARYEPFAIPPAGLRHPHRWDGRRARYLQGFLDRFDVVSIQFLHSWGFTREMMRTGCFTVRPWGSDIHPPPDGPQPPDETVRRRCEMLRHASAVTATCRSFAEAIADYADIDAASIATTPLGVDLDAFRPRSMSLDTRRDPVIGFLKGFGYAYGAPRLIRALPRVVAAHPRVRCVMVGDGPQRNTCQRLAGELGVADHIRWLPRQAPADVPELLAGWSVSVIPSVTESFGITALESAAAGVPVVATRVGGLCETVRDGVTGLLFDPTDSSALADTLIRALDDAGLRRALGSAGRDFVAAHYAWPRCIDAWENCFAAARERALHTAGV